MKTIISLALAIVILGIVAMVSIASVVYRYKDCKRVGHTTFYCLTSK
jgi:hypothetical protein